MSTTPTPQAKKKRRAVGNGHPLYGFASDFLRDNDLTGTPLRESSPPSKIETIDTVLEQAERVCAETVGEASRQVEAADRLYRETCDAMETALKNWIYDSQMRAALANATPLGAESPGPSMIDQQPSKGTPGVGGYIE